MGHNQRESARSRLAVPELQASVRRPSVPEAVCECGSRRRLDRNKIVNYLASVANQKKWAREFKAKAQQKLSALRTAIKTYVTAHRNAAKSLAAASSRSSGKGAGAAAAGSETQPAAKAKRKRQSASADCAVWSKGLRLPNCEEFVSEQSLKEAPAADLNVPYKVSNTGVAQMLATYKNFKANIDFFETSLNQSLMAKGFVRASCYPGLSSESPVAIAMQSLLRSSDEKQVRPTTLTASMFDVAAATKIKNLEMLRIMRAT